MSVSLDRDAWGDFMQLAFGEALDDDGMKLGPVTWEAEVRRGGLTNEELDHVLMLVDYDKARASVALLQEYRARCPTAIQMAEGLTHAPMSHTVQVGQEPDGSLRISCALDACAWCGGRRWHCIVCDDPIVPGFEQGHKECLSLMLDGGFGPDKYRCEMCNAQTERTQSAQTGRKWRWQDYEDEDGEMSESDLERLKEFRARWRQTCSMHGMPLTDCGCE